MKGSYKYAKLYKMNKSADYKASETCMSSREAEDFYQRSNSWSCNIDWKAIDKKTVGEIRGFAKTGKLHWAKHSDHLNCAFIRPRNPLTQQQLNNTSSSTPTSVPSAAIAKVTELQEIAQIHPAENLAIKKKESSFGEKRAQAERPVALSPLGYAGI